MYDFPDDEDLPDVGVPASAIAGLFEPWDELDGAVERLLISTRTNMGAPPLVAAVVAARDALRSPVYAVMRAYQAEIAEAERLLARAEELAELQPLQQVFVVPGLFDQAEWEGYSDGARLRVGPLFNERVDDCLEGFEALGPDGDDQQQYRRL